MSPLVALDIGGANIKAAHSSGQALTIPFEVWKRPDELGRAIAAAAAALPLADRAVVTMTAELCDCYPTKAVGVGAVLDAAVEGLQGRSIVVWGSTAQFHSVAEIRQNPQLAAAANWLALATLAARLVPASRGILIDIGTTTADLIPIDSGQVRRRGRTDTERLPDRRACLRGRAANAHLRTGNRACHYGESPPAWPPRSSRRRWISTWYWAISIPSPRTSRRPMADPRQLPQRATAWLGWSVPIATASLLWMQSRSLRPPMNA